MESRGSSKYDPKLGGPWMKGKRKFESNTFKLCRELKDAYHNLIYHFIQAPSCLADEIVSLMINLRVYGGISNAIGCFSEVTSYSIPKCWNESKNLKNMIEHCWRFKVNMIDLILNIQHKCEAMKSSSEISNNVSSYLQYWQKSDLETVSILLHP
nr:5054_t:CDS:2 [Entrophospora candida]